MPVPWRLHVLEGRLEKEVDVRFTIEAVDLYGLPLPEQHTAIEAIITTCGDFPVVLVEGAVACVGDIDADAIVAAVARRTTDDSRSDEGQATSKERIMATSVYRCEKCDNTFEAEVGCCCQPGEAVTCPKCGDAGAKKQPEAAKPAGGCGCGGSCC